MGYHTKRGALGRLWEFLRCAGEVMYQDLVRLCQSMEGPERVEDIEPKPNVRLTVHSAFRKGLVTSTPGGNRILFDDFGRKVSVFGQPSTLHGLQPVTGITMTFNECRKCLQDLEGIDNDLTGGLHTLGIRQVVRYHGNLSEARLSGGN
jgi:hypothetical protein